MPKTTPLFKENDILLINDRGFLSHEMLNYLKNERRVVTYIPAMENMTIFQDAVRLIQNTGKW